jgi:hypothetical protein
MAAPEAPDARVEKYDIEGHSVEIRTRDGHEELWLDGTRRKFFATDQGYTLHEDAYVRPFKSLREAAEAYLKRLSRGNQK